MEMCRFQHAGKATDLHPIQGLGPIAPRLAADVEDDGLALLLGEFNHRIRNLLAIVEAAVRQTQASTVEDYRAKLMARISGLSRLYQLIGRSDGGTAALTDLVEQTMRPYCANGHRVFAAGPDLDLEPKLALALHLVLHELATNAIKHGALRSSFGSVRIRWDVRHGAEAVRKLALVWTEHGGPEVKRPRHRGFGSRLITQALEGYGNVQLDFGVTGLACHMLIDIDHNVPTHQFSSSASSP